MLALNKYALNLRDILLQLYAFNVCYFWRVLYDCFCCLYQTVRKSFSFWNLHTFCRLLLLAMMSGIYILQKLNFIQKEKQNVQETKTNRCLWGYALKERTKEKEKVWKRDSYLESITVSYDGKKWRVNEWDATECKMYVNLFMPNLFTFDGFYWVSLFLMKIKK